MKMNRLSVHAMYLLFVFSLTHSAWHPLTESTIVDRFGQPRVEGNRIVGKDGRPLTLRGMSLFWSQWMGRFYNTACIRWLRDDWKCTVIRASMGIEYDGYLEQPQREMKKIKTVINACLELGIYVIVDWHDHHAHKHREEAIRFFTEIARLYGDRANVIYEIFNEPEKISWQDTIRPYAQAVVDAIRLIDPDNLIIVGTPTWSQDVDVAAKKPLTAENVAYALHFYAGTHKQYLRDKAAAALEQGAALFVSEYGTCLNTGDGPIDYEETNLWYMFMSQHALSWCNWSVADKNETSAALKSGALSDGKWPLDMISESGFLVRERLRQMNSVLFDSLAGQKEIRKEK